LLLDGNARVKSRSYWEFGTTIGFDQLGEQITRQEASQRATEGQIDIDVLDAEECLARFSPSEGRKHNLFYTPYGESERILGRVRRSGRFEPQRPSTRVLRT
jgi:hypothetical protein